MTIELIRQNALAFIKQSGGDTTLMPTSPKQTVQLCETALAFMKSWAEIAAAAKIERDSRTNYIASGEDGEAD